MVLLRILNSFSERDNMIILCSRHYPNCKHGNFSVVVVSLSDATYWIEPFSGTLQKRWISVWPQDWLIRYQYFMSFVYLLMLSSISSLAYPFFLSVNLHKNFSSTALCWTCPNHLKGVSLNIPPQIKTKKYALFFIFFYVENVWLMVRN